MVNWKILILAFFLSCVIGNVYGLDYWVDDTNTSLWGELNITNDTIGMYYYGNCTKESESNATEVFGYDASFSTDEGWTETDVSNHIAIENGKLNITDAGSDADYYICTDITLPINNSYVSNFDFEVTSAWNGRFAVYVGGTEQVSNIKAMRDTDDFAVFFAYEGVSDSVGYVEVSKSGSSASDFVVWNANTKRIRGIYDGAIMNTTFYDSGGGFLDDVVTTLTIGNTGTLDYLCIGAYRTDSVSSTTDVELDNILIREYLPTLPTVDYGTIETGSFSDGQGNTCGYRVELNITATEDIDEYQVEFNYASLGSNANGTLTDYGDVPAPAGRAIVFNQPEGTFLDYEITYNWTFYNFTDNPAPCWRTLNDTTESLGNFATTDSVQGTWNMSMGTYFGNITCEDQGTNYTSNNLTFTVLYYNETAPAYDTNENETVDTTLTGKLDTTANVSGVNATLIYNYTSYPSICNKVGSVYSCGATLEPPLVASNNTNIPFYFLYTINLTNGSQYNIVGDSSNQTIEWAYWITNFTSTSDVLEGDTFTTITNIGYAAGVGATVQANVTLNETSYMQTGALPQFSATLTAPQTNVNSTNYTLNSTVYLTHAATSTSREIQSNDNITEVWRLQLLNCGGLSSTVAMNVTTYDEQTEVAISAAHSQAYTCTSGAVERIYSFANASTEYSEICIYPSWATFRVDSLEFYDSTGYSYTDYFLDNATFTNATTQQSIYLLNDSVGKLTIITVRDSGVGVEEAYVFANRYYPGTNTYKTVAMTKTDDSGEGAAILQPNEPWYKFTVIKDGETLLVSASQKVVCEESASTCYVTLNVEDTVIDHWTYYNDITGNCTYQNATNKVVCNWVDTTGLMQWVRLRVTSVGVTATDVICDVNSTSASGTLYCDIPPTFTGEFTYNLWAKYNPEYPLDSGSVNLGETNIFGDGGIMLAILIFIVLAGVGVWSPPAGILLGLLALVACYGLGIIGSESGTGALAGIGVAGVVMALRMRQ